MKPTEEFLARYRTVSLERLGRVETAWFAITQGAGGAAMAASLRRELHTLKGDSTLIGYDGIAKLCQRLEDLASISGDTPDQVDDETDLLFTMALQFAGMILRAPAPTALTGIDLPGFLKQVDEALARSREGAVLGSHDGPRNRPSGRFNAPRAGEALTELRERLAVAATTAFVEHRNARGKARTRLRDLWLALKQEVEALPLVPIGELLEQGVHAARQLAGTLDKQVRVSLEHEPVRVPPQALETLSTAVVHALRNAIDHGIEPPALRRDRGKPAQGHVRVTARRRDELVEVAIEDDGGGVDLVAVERIARERGLVDRAPLGPEAVAELVFRHGFSTRGMPTEVSGRGVGLDAVKTAVEAIGGTVQLVTHPGRGTRLVVRVPTITDRVELHRFRCPGSALPFGVATDWSAAPEADATLGVDLLRIVQLERDPTRVDDRPHGVVRLTRGDQVIRIQIASELERAVARRGCPTGDTSAVEIVSVGGAETLLVRPERVIDLARPRENRNALAMDRTRRHLILRATIIHAGGTVQATATSTTRDTLFVRTEETIRVGDRVRVVLAFPRLLAPIELDARVASRHAGSNPGEPAGLTLSALPGDGSRDRYAALVEAELGPPGPARLGLLVADRNPTMLAAYLAAARRHGATGGTPIDVDVATHADAAWGHLVKKRHHVAVIDHELADGPCDRLIARMRATSDTAALPVIAVCAAGQSTAAEALAAGADVFLEKPLPLANLMFTIDHLHRRRQT